MNDLFELIEYIQDEHNKNCKSWKQHPNYYYVNMKNKNARDIFTDFNIFKSIYLYHDFLNDAAIDIQINLQIKEFNSVISSRVKAINSISYKMSNYYLKHEQGHVAINKCLNDCFGVRIILEKDMDYDKIVQIISEKYPNIKCINSTKQKYKAVHIYFGKGDNSKFQWELQVWNKKDENNNRDSHAKYKQGYTTWEHENKGGGEK